MVWIVDDVVVNIGAGMGRYLSSDFPFSKNAGVTYLELDESGKNINMIGTESEKAKKSNLSWVYPNIAVTVDDDGW